MSVCPTCELNTATVPLSCGHVLCSKCTAALQLAESRCGICFARFESLEQAPATLVVPPSDLALHADSMSKYKARVVAARAALVDCAADAFAALDAGTEAALRAIVTQRDRCAAAVSALLHRRHKALDDAETCADVTLTQLRAIRDNNGLCCGVLPAAFAQPVLPSSRFALRVAWPLPLLELIPYCLDASRTALDVLDVDDEHWVRVRACADDGTVLDASAIASVHAPPFVADIVEGLWTVRTPRRFAGEVEVTIAAPECPVPIVLRVTLCDTTQVLLRSFCLPGYLGVDSLTAHRLNTVSACGAYLAFNYNLRSVWVYRIDVDPAVLILSANLPDGFSSFCFRGTSTGAYITLVVAVGGDDMVQFPILGTPPYLMPSTWRGERCYPRVAYCEGVLCSMVLDRRSGSLHLRGDGDDLDAVCPDTVWTAGDGCVVSSDGHLLFATGTPSMQRPSHPCLRILSQDFGGTKYVSEVNGIWVEFIWYNSSTTRGKGAFQRTLDVGPVSALASSGTHLYVLEKRSANACAVRVYGLYGK